MPRTTLEPGLLLASVLPSDWEAATEQESASIKDGTHEILDGLGCLCNGASLARNSVATTVNQRIRALAISRRVDVGIRELARGHGVDVETATEAEIIAASSPEQVNALIAFEFKITQETIERFVTNDEMATIEREEMAKERKIRDTNWDKDLSQFVRRAVPHSVTTTKPNPASTAETTLPSLFVVERVGLDLLTLKAEVDDNGEVCCWMYEEPVIAVP